MTLFIVPDSDDIDTDGSGPDEPEGEGLGNLPYLALTLMESAISKLDWNVLLPTAKAVTTSEEDAKDVIRLMKSVVVSVDFPCDECADCGS